MKKILCFLFILMLCFNSFCIAENFDIESISSLIPDAKFCEIPEIEVSILVLDKKDVYYEGDIITLKCVVSGIAEEQITSITWSESADGINFYSVANQGITYSFAVNAENFNHWFKVMINY